jgi:hypothetical protein
VVFVVLAVLAVRQAQEWHRMETTRTALVASADPVTARSLAAEAARSQEQPVTGPSGAG